jgi:sugar lactone lactonase YvrE
VPAGIAIACALVLACSTSLAAAATTTLRFTLPAERRTSAAILDVDGRVLRTLWSGRTLAAGTHVERWDGRDDLGVPVPPGRARARVVHHAVSYEWEGVVGNTSATFTGEGVHRSMFPPAAIAIAGDAAALALGYDEGQVGTRGFALADPQTAIAWQPDADPFTAWTVVTGDAGRWYWATSGGLSKTTFVIATDRTTRSRLPFPAGRDLCLQWNGPNCYPHTRYRGAIDVGDGRDAPPTGIAVQPRGSLLAVAHARARVVRLFDRASGARVGEFAIESDGREANQLAAAPDGDLWVIEGGRVRRWTGLPSAPRVVATIEGLDAPLAIAVDPADRDRVLVADGGARGQLRAFDADGRELWTLGARGGRGTDPAAALEGFGFAGPGDRERTALAIERDGAVWLVDTATNRLLRYDRDLRRTTVVAWLPASYSATVDPNSPRRVFANYLEYDVDPAGRLRPGPDGGWRLVRDWLAGLPSRARPEDARNGAFAGLQSVVTLPNGRTYALTRARGEQHVLELPATGPARWLRTLPRAAPGESTPVLQEDGSLRYVRAGGGGATVYARDLEGFAPDGVPRWSALPRALATLPATADAPVWRGAFSGSSGPRFPTTSRGEILSFDPGVEPRADGVFPRFHLGAFDPATRRWTWRASPPGAFDVEGAFPSRAFDPHVQYGGNVLWLRGRNVVYGFHGEGFSDPASGHVGQANRFVHFRDDGTYLGRFGVPTTRATGPAAAGVAGNAFSSMLVTAGDELRLYHNDESQHGGVHRWAIRGLDGIVDLVGAGEIGTEIVLR